MKQKFVLLVFVTLCLGLFLPALSDVSLDYEYLAIDLRYRLADSSPDFEDSELQTLIVMGKIAMIAHSVSEKSSYQETLTVGQQYLNLAPPHGNSLDVMYVEAVAKVSGGANGERALSWVGLEDLGHRHIVTDAALSWYCFFRDTSGTFIYVFPASAAVETLRVTVVYAGFYTTEFYMNPGFLGGLMEYALFLAFVRLENWSAAADHYNEYRSQVAILREELTNKQPDITVGPKIIE